MKVALVTTPPSVASRVGERVQRLVPELGERLELQLFVADELAGEELAGLPTHPARALRPREVDRILYPIGDERAHAFMLPMIRRLGGVVALHDWALCDLAGAAYPELERGGWRGRLRALREGGLEQARSYGRWGEAGGDATREGLTLNRSVVRFGDAFLVLDEQTRQRVLRDRNAPTPTRVAALQEQDDALADLWAEALESFPHHRSSRKSLIRTAIEQADRVREERRQS